jgi:hypothetical protein
MSGNPSANIMRWNGNQFLPVGLGTNGHIWKMHKFGRYLYICGDFTMVDNTSVSGIARWDGQQWEPACPNFPTYGNTDCIVINNELYITGSFDFNIGTDTFRHILKYPLPVSVEEINSTNELLIFPNPVHDHLYINNYEQNLINIYDVTGNLCFTGILDQAQVENLTAGIYYLEAILPKKIYRTKFIKD